ncbi:hypothetical protein [Desulfobacter latus]|uniref:Uncharacterized protein n=1 Tax=Desulfobacter latus TaxID=2292 RepID=A0A850TB28_9BACT|nr:hypothetical protein [Desulfobacter latus]NWH05437.1 hypothetical protein [Desulfobacter latus]
MLLKALRADDHAIIREGLKMLLENKEWRTETININERLESLLVLTWDLMIEWE